MTKTQQESETRIRHAKVDSLCIYEITEDELISLEQGSPGSTYLNFAIFLLSIAIALLATLFTTKIESDRTYLTFVVFIVIGFILGIFFFIKWIIAYISTTPTSKKIRGRLKEESENIEAAVENGDSTSTVGIITQ